MDIHLEFHFGGGVKRGLTLGGEHSSVSEGVSQQLVVGLSKERLRRADGIGGIRNDHIKGILVLFQELEAVSDKEIQLGVGEAGRHPRKVPGGWDKGVEHTGTDFLATSMTIWSISHIVTLSTESCFNTSRRIPPSPPPMIRT